MLWIKTSTKQAIIDHALEDSPIEACGVIAGKIYTGGADDRLIKMDNVAEEWGTSFQFDPDQQIGIWNDMESRGELPVAIYHSHTKHRAVPSDRDQKGAWMNRSHHIIVSTLDRDNPEFKSFVLVDGCLIQEEIEEI